MDPVASLGLVGLTRRSSTSTRRPGARRECGRVARRATCAARGYTVAEQPVDDDRFNVLATLDAPRVVAVDALRLRAAVLSEPRRGRRGSTAAASCDAKGILAAQVEAAERLRAGGDPRRRAAVRRRRGARQRRRRSGQHAGAADVPVSDQRRADRQPARHWRRAASTACGCTRTAAPRIRRIPSSASRRSRSCIDALVRLRHAAVAGRSGPGPDALQRRPDRGRRRAQRDPAARRGRGAVPHRRRRRRPCATALAALGADRSTIEDVLESAAGAHAHRRRASRPRCFPT